MQERLVTIPMGNMVYTLPPLCYQPLNIMNTKKLTVDLAISGDGKIQFRISVKNPTTVFARNLALGFVLVAALCVNLVVHRPS